MKQAFPEFEKHLGFGFMRLPLDSQGQVDIPQTMQMVDLFLQRGFCYFDTAHGYLDGQSELALRTCLTSRYPRERYVLTNKLSANFFRTQQDIRPLFQQQLEACGVEYFDLYLMHALSQARLPQYRHARAFETALELKAEGKIRHIGISFHDSADVLEQILTEFPMIEAVQLQFNYLDFKDEKVQAEKCYQVCRSHGKPVLVMEPVKGGALVNLPPQAQQIFSGLGGGSNASYAIRYAAGFPGVAMVLSGMSTLEQVQDNTGFMAAFQPLSEQEQLAVAQVCGILRCQDTIPCTACRYCTEVCPQGIPIPELFAAENQRRQGRSPAPVPGPRNCLDCGRCESACPQSLPIRTLLSALTEAN